MRPVIIIGAGGHAKVVADSLDLNGHEILGFVNPDLPVGTEIFKGVVIGDDRSIKKNYHSSEVFLANGIGSLPGSQTRWQLLHEYRLQGYTFLQVIHPSSVISANVEIGQGAQIMAGVVIQPGCRVGADSIINTGVSLDHDCIVGKEVHIAPGAVCSGDVCIGDGSHVGPGVTIIQGVEIAHHSVIAAGTVIHQNIQDNVLVKNPHKIHITTLE